MLLSQGLKMELKVKNLASSDSRGYDLQKEVMVKVTKPRTHEVRPHQWAGRSLLGKLPKSTGFWSAASRRPRQKPRCCLSRG